MKRQVLIAVILFFFHHLAIAQPADSSARQYASTKKRKIKNNTVFFEFLGNAGYSFYSVNYDRIFPFKRTGAVGIRAGGSYVRDADFYSFPLLLNFITGKYDHHFEIGFGGQFTAQANYNNHLPTGRIFPAPTANIGYRYQPFNGGFFAKIAYTPVFYDVNATPFSGILILFRYNCGFSVGYTF